MLLYWNNATASGYWDDTGNWWEDSTGTTTPHGALPVSGDSCSLASNAGTDEPTINTATVDLGTGVCDIYGVTLSSLGTIAGGTWTGYYVLIYGAITGGTFTGTGNQYNSGCAITGGTFTGTSNQFNSGCTISGGAFTSATANFQYGCSVNGGVFTGWENWDSTITGGIWVLSGTATVNGYTVTGASQSNPGFSIVVSGPTLPAVGNVMYGIDRGDGVTGTHTDPNTDGHTPNAALVLNTAHFGAANATAGTYASGTIPAASDVRHGVAVGSGTGTCYVPAAADVRHGTNVDATTGTAYIPGASDTRHGVNVDATTGTCYVPTAAQTLYGVSVDVAGTGTVTLPNTDGHTADASQVSTAAHFGAGNATAGTLDMSTYVLKNNVVSASYVVSGYDNYSGGSAGTYPTTATTQAADATTLSNTTLHTDGTNTTVAFGASNATAHTAAVYSAGYSAGEGAQLGIAAAVWANARRTLTGTGGAIGPTAGANLAPVPFGPVVPSQAIDLSACVFYGGQYATIEATARIQYTIYRVEDEGRGAIAVPGHTAVALTPVNVLYDTPQTDAEAANYNFRFRPDSALGQPFPRAGRYLVTVTFETTSGATYYANFVGRAAWGD